MSQEPPIDPAEETAPVYPKLQPMTPEYFQNSVNNYNRGRMARYDPNANPPDPSLIDLRRNNDPGIIELRERHNTLMQQAKQKVEQSYPNMSEQARRDLQAYIDFERDAYEKQTLFVSPSAGTEWSRQHHFRYAQEYQQFLPPESKRMVEMTGYELQGPGPLNNLMNNFYDEKKGGLQMGGLIGGALGLMAGLFMMNSAGGGLIGWLITAMTTIGFAYAGNKVAEYMSGPEPAPFQSTPALGATPVRTVSRGPGQQEEVAPSNHPEAIAAAYQQSLTPPKPESAHGNNVTLNDVTPPRSQWEQSSVGREVTRGGG